MHHTTFRTLSGAIAVTALLATAATLIVGSPAQARPSLPRDLHFVEKGGGIKFVDNPPKAKHQYDFSAGDIVIVSRSLYTPQGIRTGSLAIVCVATSQTTQQCNGTEMLPNGTLEVAGVSTPDPSTTVAVVGGTGTYSAARGTSVSEDRKTNTNIADQTITLQR